MNAFDRFVQWYVHAPLSFQVLAVLASWIIGLAFFELCLLGITVRSVLNELRRIRKLLENEDR